MAGRRSRERTARGPVRFQRCPGRGRDLSLARLPGRPRPARNPSRPRPVQRALPGVRRQDRAPLDAARRRSWRGGPRPAAGSEAPGVRAAGETRAHRSPGGARSEEHTSELQSPCNLVCRLLLEKKKKKKKKYHHTNKKKAKKTNT